MGEAGAQIGAYRLVRPIGAGGMGEVWLAEHAMLGRRAAIKLLNASFADRPEIVTRFFNEARAATAIADPGIVQIFDFGQHEGSAYIVMELLEGETLDARWRRGLGMADALRIMRQVASSLGAAHTAGIVHRDLKPENIFLVRDPEVAGGERAKILDFGIAKLTADPGVKTQTSVVMGTPTFMSPEQCRGAGLVDQRSDIYSLGCVLFAMVTGRPPFVAEGTGELIAMHLREAPPRAASIAPHIPAALDDLIARCLAKDPAGRFASGTALAGALGALITSPGPSVVGLAQASVPTTLSSSAAAVAPPARTRRRGSAIVAGAVLAIACIAFASWRLASSTSEHVAAGPSIDAPPAPDAQLAVIADAAIADAPAVAVVADAAVVDAAPVIAAKKDRPPAKKPPVAKQPVEAKQPPETKPPEQPKPVDESKPKPERKCPKGTPEELCENL
jgi:eukaryotic-like serine/threonine-protein kinase